MLDGDSKHDTPIRYLYKSYMFLDKRRAKYTMRSRYDMTTAAARVALRKPARASQHSASPMAALSDFQALSLFLAIVLHLRLPTQPRTYTMMFNIPPSTLSLITITHVTSLCTTLSAHIPLATLIQLRTQPDPARRDKWV